MSKTKFQELLDNSGIKRQVIAQKMGMTRGGFYRKQKEPRKRFDSDEVVRLASIIGVDSKVVFEAILVS